MSWHYIRPEGETTAGPTTTRGGIVPDNDKLDAIIERVDRLTAAIDQLYRVVDASTRTHQHGRETFDRCCEIVKAS